MSIAMRVALAALVMLAWSPGFGTAQAAGDRAFGEYLSAECVTCHRVTGQSQGIPSIAGLPPATFVDLLTQYRRKQRANPIMQTIASRLTGARRVFRQLAGATVTGERRDSPDELVSKSRTETPTNLD